MNNVEKTIGWAKWSLNPVKGLCPVGCPYCYSRRLYQRNLNDVFKDKTIRYDPTVFIDLYKAKPSDRIFVGSTIELFHPLCSKWNNEILDICASNSDVTFIFLTKLPRYLPKEFPDNCWVGVSVTANGDMTKAYYGLSQVKADKRFISFEPLKGMIGMSDHVNIKEWLDWVIIGAQTPYSKKTAPRIEWVKEIVDSANKAHISVFLKNNLHRVFEEDARQQILKGVVPECVIPIWAGNKERYLRHLRQEFPKVN